MFEQLTHDPGEQGLEPAARMFHILAVFNLIAIPASFVLYGSRPALLVLMVVISLTSALVAYTVARGIERQQNWAKWLGMGFAVLTMLNVPIGTIVGVVTLVYLNRAAKSGLFAAGALTASGASSVTPQNEGTALSPVLRGAIIGMACGFAVLLVLMLAIGQPDSYFGKIVVLAGGGALVGAFIGSFRRH